MKWKDKLIDDIVHSIRKTNKNAAHIEEILLRNRVNIHLGVFSEPFLSLIFCGKKTIESRFSINHVAPYRRVLVKDIVLIKKSGGAIMGFFVVKEVLYFNNLKPDKIDQIEAQYGQQLGWRVDPAFLSTKLDSKYLSLILFDKVVTLNPIETDKADRTGWSIVKLGLNDTLFEDKNNQDAN